MKLFSDILYKAGLVEIQGSTNVAITSMTFDSRKVEKDGLFVATRGTQVDGHEFIEKAISLGAAAIAKVPGITDSIAAAAGAAFQQSYVVALRTTALSARATGSPSLTNEKNKLFLFWRDFGVESGKRDTGGVPNVTQ